MNTTTIEYRDARASALELAERDVRLIIDEARRLADDFAGSTLHDERLLRQIEMAADGLGDAVRGRLIAFRDDGDDDGVLLVRGLPLDELPPTPSGTGTSPAWTELPVATVGQLMIMSQLGRSLSYIDEKCGQLVQDVCPQPGAEQRQENSGSVLLELHTEDGFHPNMPHFLSLLGLRGDHDGVAVTVTAGVRATLGDLDQDTIAQLGRPDFRIRYSSSFTGGDEAWFSSPMPVLGAAGELRVDFHASEGVTPAATEALARLESAMRDRLVGVVLEPGELLVVDNRAAVHGRTGFQPRYDGTDRWLRRSFAVTDLRPVRPRLVHGRAHEAITVGR
ncbi:TauD/TfdA family dioxygenase [Micromonospora sp. NPDC048935]|uniref:TauD/TfdA family dioxygenase n=1 Tax=Micromonospora sp. NPDC048935 TaxID=3364262 RepID=UPI00371F3D52